MHVAIAQFSVVYGSVSLMENYVQCKEVAGTHCSLLMHRLQT